MRNLKSVLLILIAFGVAACGGTAVTRQDASNAQFAAKPSDAEAIGRIRSHLSNVLIDPDSLRLKCSQVRKGWGRNNMFDKPIFGWVVLCDVNAKNRFGGYTGGKPHLFIFNGNYFAAIDSPYVADGSGTHAGFLD